MSYRITYSGHLAVLEGYSDLNWIYDVDVLYATSGYLLMKVAQCHGGLANKPY